ncbi:hypothetical protein [Zobellia uliginosa]|uniref:hypothetical protein n=1 Tax=Zobellia uliginosa TaxID=143224 RepID=UPI001C076DDA|nr:hypothetical protein [Zobellia uliginosa]MBU2947827.1 hypothetical protein [Zobellia uliginosa]
MIEKNEPILPSKVVISKGITIAFLGPDGSGKSTIIDQLIKEKLPFKQHDYFHLKPIVSKGNSENVVTNPHEEKEYSTIKSILKLFFFMYQYNSGWVKNIKELKKKKSLIIFDRYYDDLLVDNKRYRYGASIKLAKFFRVLIPRPELYFILTAAPSVIYSRKQEVPFTELERQVKGYRALADGKRYFSMDVNREPKDIVKDIVKIIIEHTNEYR